MKDFELLWDEGKVVISPSLRDKMKYLIRKDTFISKSNLCLLEDKELNIRNFFSIYDSVYNSIRISVNVHLEYPGGVHLDNNLLKQVLDLSEKINNFKMQDDYVNVDEIIHLMYEFKKTESTMYLMRDLNKAKNDCIKDMNYFMNQQSIDEFNNAFEDASKENNLDKMKELILNIQKLILNEWSKYIQNVDNMTDDNFCFIGHSTSFTKYDKEFFTRFVSCSLYDQEIHDTYHLGFGFIFAPQNIVGASSKDMYVRNSASSEDNLLDYSSVPIIHHPKRVLEETKNKKEENIQNNDYKRVYNEVVIDGFEPIGIFCFTNGLKSLDINYRYALELQKSFPNLKIKEFDTFKAKRGEELLQSKFNIISHLRDKFIENEYSISINDVLKYDLFFEEFEKLKQSGNYDEKDIERIFKYNLSLLSIFNKEPQELLSGSKYTDKEIKYILGKNVKYNFDEILNGRVTSYYFDKILDLKNYQGKIEKYYPGFTNCINLISNIDINNQLIDELKKNKFTNFDELTNFLQDKFNSIFASKEKEMLSEIHRLNITYEELTSEKIKRENEQKTYEYYKMISSVKVWLIKKEYKDAEKNIMYDTDELECLQTRKRELEQKNSILSSMIEKIVIDDLDDEESLELKRRMDSLNLEKEKYSKHKIINAIKIKKINTKLQKIINSLVETIRMKKNDLQSQILTNNFEINMINLEIEYKISTLDINTQNLEEIKRQLLEVCGCSSIEDLEKLQSLAKHFLETYDYSNSFILSELDEKLQSIEKMLSSYNTRLDSMRQAISRR